MPVSISVGRLSLLMMIVATLSVTSALNDLLPALAVNVSESGIGMALLTFAVNVKFCAVFTIAEVFSLTVRLMEDAST